LVEQLAVCLARHPLMRLALAVDLENGVHGFFELANGKGRAVDQHPTATAGRNLALYDELGIGIDSDRLERLRRNRETPLCRHLFGAGADHFGRSAPSAKELERVDQERFAGARLAGE